MFLQSEVYFQSCPAPMAGYFAPLLQIFFGSYFDRAVAQEHSYLAGLLPAGKFDDFLSHSWSSSFPSLFYCRGINPIQITSIYTPFTAKSLHLLFTYSNDFMHVHRDFLGQLGHNSSKIVKKFSKKRPSFSHAFFVVSTTSTRTAAEPLANNVRAKK